MLDDRWLVLRNPLIRGLEHIPELFTSSYYAPNMELGLYRPLVTISYGLNHAVGGLDATGYHAVNVFLHATNAVLVLALGWFLGLGPFVAEAAALLFAAHAVHAEAIANVAGRAELLAAAFFLLALVLHLARGRAARRRTAVLYGASLAASFAALLCKENTIALLPVIVVADLTLGRVPGRSLRSRLGGLLRERGVRVYVGYLAIIGLYALLRLNALGTDHVTPPTPAIDNPLVLLPQPWVSLSALEVAWRYVGLLLFPAHLSYDYSYAQIPLVRHALEPRLWAALLLTAGAAWGTFQSWRRAPPLFFALAFYALTFFPVSNLAFRIGTILGERLLYLPSVGFCLAAAWLLERGAQRVVGARRTRIRLAVGAVALLVATHAVRSVVRNADWQSAERLYLHDVQASPRSAKALNNAGWILIDRDLDAARGVALLERALEIWPDEPEYLDSLGWGYYKLGRLAEARERLRRSLRLAPSGPTAGDRREHLRVVEVAMGVE